MPLNEFSFASLILFGNRESEYIANYTLLVFLLLCFHASLKFTATLAEGFFTYSACSRQGGSWYLGKLKLISAEKAFLWDCFFVNGRADVKRRPSAGLKSVLLLHTSCFPGSQVELWVTVHLAYAVRVTVTTDPCRQALPFAIVRAWPPFSWLHFFFFNLPEPFFQQLGMSVYGGKFSWHETQSNL